MTTKHLTPATPLRTGADVQAHPMEALNEIARLRADRAKLVEALRWYVTGQGKPDFDGEIGRSLLREIGEE